MFTNYFATRFSPDYEYADTLLSFLEGRTRFAVCRAMLARPVDEDRRGRTRRQPVARRKKANSFVNENGPLTAPVTPMVDPNPALPSPSEMLELLKSNWGDETDTAGVKFHLLDSYLDLQQSVPVGENDVVWENMLLTGTMHQTIEGTFTSRETLKEHLLAKLATCS